MPYPTAIDHDTVRAGQVIDQGAQAGDQFAAAVRDIFNDTGWTSAELVRARGWHDVGARADAGASETTFD